MNNDAVDALRYALGPAAWNHQKRIRRIRNIRIAMMIALAAAVLFAVLR